MIRKNLLFIALMLGSSIANALTVYEWIDANGQVHYAADPQPGAVAVQINNSTLQQAALETTQVPQNYPSTQQSSSAIANGTVRILSPKNGYNVLNTDTLTVNISLTSSLMSSGGQAKLFVDGQLTNTTFQAIPPALVVTHLTRGSHILQVRTFDAQGNLLNQSQIINIFVRLPHLPIPNNS